MRALTGLLLAGFLIVTGVWPPLAALVGSLLLAAFGLAVTGAAALLAQTAVQILLAVALGLHLHRNRRLA